MKKDISNYIILFLSMFIVYMTVFTIVDTRYNESIKWTENIVVSIFGGLLLCGFRYHSNNK